MNGKLSGAAGGSSSGWISGNVSAIVATAALGFLLAVGVSGSVLSAHAIVRAVRSNVPPAPKTLTVLYSFQGSPDGSNPSAGAIVDRAGNVFGTTVGGGSANDGSVFELTPSGSSYRETIVHSFTGSDGAAPYAAPQEDMHGNLLVTASGGGSDQDGTVVELSPRSSAYQETALFSFDSTDGDYPAAGFLKVGKTFYTTTVDGGAYGYGAIVSLTPTASGLRESDVYDFQNAPDGAYPQSPLVADSSGAVYGTTYYGGNGDCSHGNHLYYHCGTVFKFVPSGSGGTETVLMYFSGGDGADPAAGLILDATGNLYGTTVFGGGLGCGTNGQPPGCGTVFELKPNGSQYKQIILRSFAGSPDGEYPYATLIAKGNDLYGTTEFGGSGPSACGSLGCGTIFKMSASGKHYTVLHSFVGSDGEQPLAGLFVKGRSFYGTTSSGGTNSCSCGEVFEFAP